MTASMPAENFGGTTEVSNKVCKHFDKDRKIENIFQ